MTSPSLFKWRHFEPEIIVCGVRWYLRSAWSYRDVEELMLERDPSVDHATVFRWVQRYAPEGFDHRVGHFWPLRIRGVAPKLPCPQ